MTSDYLRFAIAALVASCIELPIISGITQLPSFILGLVPGTAFSIAMVVCISTRFRKHRQSAPVRTMAGVAASLWCGLPLSILGGIGTLVVTDHLLPGIKYQYRGTSASFALAELTSSLIWSLALWLSVVSLGHELRIRFLMLCSAAMIVFVVFCNIADIFTSSYLQKSIFFPLITLGGQVLSASLIAFSLDEMKNSMGLGNWFTGKERDMDEGIAMVEIHPRAGDERPLAD